MKSFPWLAACALALVSISACEEELGEQGHGAEFQGDGEDESTDNIGDDTRAEDECSLLQADSCGADKACVRSASGNNVCRDHATLAIGAPCFDTGDEICVAGALCFGAHSNGSTCVELCDLDVDACGQGSCEPWFSASDKEIGRCME